MFMGEYRHTIDQKGRLIIPAKFRDDLGDKFVATKGLDRCLFVYSPDEWSNLEQRLKALPLTNKDARAFVRFFFAGAAECEIDKQGRILLPANLREYASLVKDVVLVGVLTRVEIWSKDIWDEYNEQANLDHESIAERMADLGI
ncbi:MAG: transcriptional regulator MraZ [Clostridiales bacterium]|nr:transcriptional regulator MraZ [Clostridiales bacterium]